MDQVSREDIERAVDELRQEFSKHAPLPVAYRRQQISQLRKMIEENLPVLEEAMWKDLRRNACDMYLMECTLVIEECQVALDNIDTWMKPRSVPVNLVNVPGCAEIRSEALGVALIVGTWNFPISLCLAPIVGAFAAGNCVLLKVPPASQSQHISEALISLCRKYLDPRSFRIFAGDLEALKIMLDQKFDMFFYTGSTTIGRMVSEAAARKLAKCLIELGGKCPTVVTANANISISAKRIAWGAFLNSGQTCIRPDYVMVHTSIADVFIRHVKKYVQEFFGDAATSEWYCRMIHTGAAQRMKSLLEKDANFIVYGGKDDIAEKYIEPTLLDFNSDFSAFERAACMQGEIFGPLLPIVRYEDFDKCIDFINRQEKPLTAYCFCADESTKEQFVTRTSSGSVVINDTIVHFAVSSIPFGGVGNSGGGKYHGKSTFDAFSHEKSILRKTFFLDIEQRYPPITHFGQKLRRIVQFAFPKRVFTISKAVLFGLSALLFCLLWRHQKKRVLTFLEKYT